MAVLCQLMQDSLDLRASREQRLDEVVDADGRHRGWAEAGRTRVLATRFGEVTEGSPTECVAVLICTPRMRC
jgi:hypothetical protein